MLAIAKTAHTDRWRDKAQAQVVCVISNRPGAGGLAAAAALGIETQVLDHEKFASRDAFDAELALLIDNYQPRLVLLAGFMRILTPLFVARYAGRMVNIHPSLLPAFPGLNTHQRAIDAGCKFSGATVHMVTAELDHGAIVAQAKVPVLAGDDAQTLSARVRRQEHLLYPQAVFALLQADEGAVS